MAKSTVVLTIGADVSDLVTELAIAKREVSSATAEINKFAGQIVRGGENAASARVALSSWAAEAEHARSNVVQLTERLDRARSGIGATGQTAALAGYQVKNLGLQLNDAATMALSGSGAFQIAATQGGQVLQILQEAQGGVGAALKQIGGGMLGLLTPTNLAIAGVVGLGAVGAYSLYKITTEAAAARTAVSGVSAAIAASGNAGNFKSLTADVGDVVKTVTTPTESWFERKVKGSAAPINAADAEGFLGRVGAMKGATKELLDGFGQLLISTNQLFPSDFKDRAEAATKAIENPEKAAGELIASLHNLSAAQKEQIRDTMQEGTQGEKYAAVLELIAEKERLEASQKALAAEAQRVKAMGAADASGAYAQLIADEDKLLASGQRLAPMEGLLSRQFSDQIRVANGAADAMSRLADAMRDLPQTMGGAIEKASQLAEKMNTLPGRREDVERNIRTLRAGLGNAAVAPAGGERDLAIRTVYGEAGGEGEPGQAAVASVIRNRMQSGRWGGSLEGVIRSPKQFSVWNAGDPAGDRARALEPGSADYERIGRIVDDVLAGRQPDPTGGALNYYNPDAASPAWGRDMANRVTIGRHVFGTVGASGADIPPKPEGLSTEQYEKMAAAYKEALDARQKLKDAEAGGAATAQAEYEIARQNASGLKNEVADEEKRIAALEKQKALTQDLGDRNNIQLEIDRKAEGLREKRLAMTRAENQLELTRIGASDPARRRDLQVGQATRERDQFAPGTEGHVAAAERIAAFELEYQQTQIAQKRSTAETMLQIAMDELRREEQAIRQAAADGKITEDQKIAALNANLAQRKQLEMQHLNYLQQAVYFRDAANFAATEDKKTALLARAEADRKQLQTQHMREIEEGYRSTFREIGGSISGSVMGMIQGTMTLRDSARSILLQIIQSFVQGRVMMVADWLAGVAAQTTATVAGQTAQTGAVAAGTAARTGIEGAGAAASAAMIIPSVLKSIAASASQTFAGVFGFLSPVMGPLAAGPAGAASGVVAAAASGVGGSFAVGSWALPDNMIAQVHKGEMIVPAAQTPWAQSLMAAAAGGSGQSGGGHSVTVNYNAERGTPLDVLRTHSREIARIIAGEMTRNGSLRPRY